MFKKNRLIKNLPLFARPREKLLEKGKENLKDEELLAILLRTGIKGESALETAKKLLKKYPKEILFNLDPKELKKVKGVGLAKAITLVAAYELVKRTIVSFSKTTPKIETIKDIIAQIAEIRDKKQEHLMVLYLNARKELIKKEVIFIGTLNSNICHPREVFKLAFLNNATYFILSHNHPSGTPSPSDIDLLITKKMKEAGELMDVEILDHVIISKDDYFSFKENNLL